jgi:Bacterial protein of unknown function (DUF899)
MTGGGREIVTSPEPFSRSCFHPVEAFGVVAGAECPEGVGSFVALLIKLNKYGHNNTDLRKEKPNFRAFDPSSYGSDFNPDFHVSFTKDEMAQGKVNYNYTMQEFPSEEAPGISVFYRDAGGDVFHIYSTYGCGVEQLVGTYMILDMVPKGRDEDDSGFTMEWVRHHDRYGTDVFADATKPYWPATASPSPTTCSCGSAEACA